MPTVFYDQSKGDRARPGSGAKDRRAAWRASAGAEPARGRGGVYRYATHAACGARSSRIEAGKHLRECRGLPAAPGREDQMRGKFWMEVFLVVPAMCLVVLLAA